MCKGCGTVLLEAATLSASRAVIEALKTSASCRCGGQLVIRTLWLRQPRTAYTSSDLQLMLRATTLRPSGDVQRPVG
jgi:hypothetical protein